MGANMNVSRCIQLSGLGLFLCLGSIQAAWQYPGCDDVTDADFRMEQIVQLADDPELWEPIKMAFDPVYDAQNNMRVNVYYVQRGYQHRNGMVKMYDPQTDQIHKVGEIETDRENEDGLVGIVLDPDFKENRWMYLFYAKDADWLLSRFTLTPENTLDMDSEIIMLSIPTVRNRWHTGGAMQFDVYEDLWVAVGDNEACERGPANTADLRGGIVRIHPEDDGSYTIPEGNLWEFAANYFESSGDDDIAAEYRDPNKTRREIYAMGTRNAYTLTLDPVRRWATFGDCGPDFSAVSEEHTVVTEPSFLGWPYWTGAEWTQPIVALGYDEVDETFWGDKDMNAPLNLNPTADGVDLMLPHKKATHPYGHQCAMTGPIYRYDGDLQSNVKLPPHFDRVWFVTDFNLGWIKAIRLSDDGNEIVSNDDIFTTDALDVAKPLDFQVGPDGALYVLDYSCSAWRNVNPCTGIYRIEYTGSCHPDEPKLETAYYPTPGYGCTCQGDANYDPDAYGLDVHACADERDTDCALTNASRLTGSGSGISIGPSAVDITLRGRHMMTVQDVFGRQVLARESSGPATYDYSALPESGIYFVSVHTEKDELNAKICFVKK
jgi:glucose/arabinose dehydrogenase